MQRSAEDQWQTISEKFKEINHSNKYFQERQCRIGFNSAGIFELQIRSRVFALQQQITILKVGLFFLYLKLVLLIGLTFITLMHGASFSTFMYVCIVGIVWLVSILCGVHLLLGNSTRELTRAEDIRKKVFQVEKEITTLRRTLFN